MTIKTYNIVLNGEQQFKDFWVNLLAQTKDAYNYCSQLVYDNKLPLSLTAIHNFCYDKLRQQFPSLPSQSIIRVQREVLVAYKAIKSNNHKGGFPTKSSLSMTLDKRMYSNFTSESISLVSDTPQKRKTFSFKLYDKVNELFATSVAKDPTIFYRNGKLYLSVPFEVQGRMPSSITSVGVDLGMKRLFVTSEGNAFVDKQYLKERRKLRYLKRCLQSKGTHSAKRHLKKIRRKEHNLSQNLCHKSVNALLSSTSASYIVMEDLRKIKVSTSRYASGAKRTRHNNSLGQVPFYEFKRILTYKATLLGKEVVSVSPMYTSQTDSRNGVRQGNRQGCRFYCIDGVLLDADWNAAVNIAQRSKHPLSCVIVPFHGKLTYLSGKAQSTASTLE